MAINYKELILETNLENNLEEKKTYVRNKSKIEYIIEGISGPDMVVSKKTTRKHEQLVILMSQNQLYIKDMKTGKLTASTPENITTFFSGLEEPLKCIDQEGNELNWTNYFYRGAKFAKILHKISNIVEIREYMNKGLFYQNFDAIRFEDIGINRTVYPIKDYAQLLETVPEKFKRPMILIASRSILNYHVTSTLEGLDEYETTKITTLIETFMQGWGQYNIYKTYGISGMRQFIQEYFQTAVARFPNSSSITRLFNGQGKWSHNIPSTPTSFELQSLIHYLFYSSVEQGFASEISNFIDLWRDTLAMERAIFGEITDKYPDNLASIHQLYCYKYSLLQQKINDELWKEQVKKMSLYERHGEKYIIIAPKTPNDMVEESRQQSNCLSSYIRQVINGSCMIFFMRKTSEPNKSLVSIEICKDLSLGQVKAKYNKEPSYEERAYVDKWYKEKFQSKVSE